MALSLTERLREAADRCCQDEGFEESASSTREFLDLLESPLHDLELKKSSPTNWLAQCEQALQQAGELVDPSASSGLVLCEKLGLELPKVAVKFVNLSQACQDHCLSIIEALAENCSPREMFAAFMEALNMYTASQTLICCIPLIQGLSLVFSRLQRRHAQFFQEASSGLLALLRLATQDEVDDEGEEETSIESVQGLEEGNVVPPEQIRAAIVENIVQLAQVVRETCVALDVEEQREDFQQKLGMFVLQTLGIAGEQFAHPGWEVPVSVMELVELLPVCGLSMSLLFTRNQIEVLIELTSDDVTGGTDQVGQKDQKRAEALKGAALAGYWLLARNQVATALEASLNCIKEEFRITGRKGVVTALSVATSLLRGRSSRPLSSVPAAGLSLVYTLLDAASTLEFPIDDVEGDGWMALTLGSLPSLQNLQNVVVYAPSIEMRRQGYAALKKVTQDVLPEGARLQCLQILISNCPFPSLVSLHLICIKDEVAKAWPPSRQQQEKPSDDVNSAGEGQNLQHVTSPFVSEAVLEVIGNVLRPKTGSPPELPAQIDSVQSALNLYRFILIRESSGKTNYTGVLSKAALSKSRNLWLLPLRELVGGVSLGLIMEDNEMSADMTLAIDSLQSVLYRCIELNEEALARL
ncbi:hypothetical protein M758_12G024400 [Ceratodon purpureus]|nr:hypothetical protein M758_12G024400 [Ceratodon purpureus]